MSQNQEIIEAKLCAFIDGELDAEGRVEIEKHLEANPQHRRLLESLKATRDLLKWLPREAAPPEVAETLNGQLERSVLLDSEGDLRRTHFGPRMLAAAAIIALTAGLGLAVYYTLPKSQKNATPYAVRGEGSGTYGQDLPENEKVEGPAARRARAPGAMASKVSADSEGVGKAASLKGEAAELERWAKAVGENRDAITAVANGTPSPAMAVQATPVASNAVVMLVRSNAPQDTRRNVTNFLDSQKIQWKEAPAATPLSPQAQQVMAARPLLQSQQPRQMQKSDGQQIRQQGESQSATLQQVQQSEALALPTTVAATGPADSQILNNGATQPAGESFAAALAMLKQSAGDRGMYVARMSRQQAVSLGNTMALEPAQSTELKDFSGTTMTLDDLGSGKFASATNTLIRNNVAALIATTEQSAGMMSQSALSRSGSSGGGFGGGGIGGGGGRNGGSINAPVTQAADSQPVSQDQRQDLMAASARLVGPASQAVALGTTQPSEESLDVVIVVEEGASNSTTAPASQPTAQPASQPADGAATQPGGAQ